MQVEREFQDRPLLPVQSPGRHGRRRELARPGARHSNAQRSPRAPPISVQGVRQLHRVDHHEADRSLQGVAAHRANQARRGGRVHGGAMPATGDMCAHTQAAHRDGRLSQEPDRNQDAPEEHSPDER